MKPPKSTYVCQECGSQSPKWMGRCADCGAWNSFVEERVTEPTNPTVSAGAVASRYALSSTGPAKLYADIELADTPRLKSGIEEFDRVLGGGDRARVAGAARR